MPIGLGTILGGLPIAADVSFGYDDFTLEGWSKVNHIYWLKHNGEPGKEIPQHIFDRAEKYDPYFCSLMEQVSEYLAYQNSKEENS